MIQTLSREVEIEPAHTALLIVDVQNFTCSWDGGEYAGLSTAEKERRYGYFFRTFMRFETGAPELAFLNTTMAVATAPRLARRVELRCFRVL